jgi:hypothetical protein
MRLRDRSVTYIFSSGNDDSFSIDDPMVVLY